MKVKGVIHWLCAADAFQCEVRLYDRLFREPQPGTGSHEYLDDINPNAKRVITAYLEAALREANGDDRFQFERHGYFVGDRNESRRVFNRTVTLRDSWANR